MKLLFYNFNPEAGTYWWHLFAFTPRLLVPGEYFLSSALFSMHFAALSFLLIWLVHLFSLLSQWLILFHFLVFPSNWSLIHAHNSLSILIANAFCFNLCIWQRRISIQSQVVFIGWCRRYIRRNLRIFVSPLLFLLRGHSMNLKLKLTTNIIKVLIISIIVLTLFLHFRIVVIDINILYYFT